MRKSLKLFVLFMSFAFISGCATQQNGKTTANKTGFQHVSPTAQESVAEAGLDSSKGNQVIKKAKSAIGTPYVLGGSAPGGFDCSGLVKWAYSSIGVELPRTAREQSTVGTKIKNIEDMRAGDIVAFRHPKRGYHTGIYVGDGKFVHSPRKRTRVRINSLSDPYFSQTLLGARRVNVSSGNSLVAEAENRLEQYLFQKSQLTAENHAKNMTTANASKTAQATKNASATKNAKKTTTTASSKKAAPKNVKKSVATNTKKANTKTAANNKTQKTATKKVTAAKKTTSKKISQTAAAKTPTTKKTVKNTKNNSKVVAASSKAKNAKQSGHKSVSMLQTKKAKTTSRGRS